jgi:hypothetical protein
MDDLPCCRRSVGDEFPGAWVRQGEVAPGYRDCVHVVEGFDVARYRPPGLVVELEAHQVTVFDAWRWG